MSDNKAYIHVILVRDEWDDIDGVYDKIERIMTKFGHKCKKCEYYNAIDAETEMEYNEDEVKKILVELYFIPMSRIRIIHMSVFTVEEFVNKGV